MRDLFLTNTADKFLDRINENFKKCKSFTLSVSFIKKAGLVLIERNIEEEFNEKVISYNIYAL